MEGFIMGAKFLMGLIIFTIILAGPMRGDDGEGSKVTLAPENVTTSWNLSALFEKAGDASAELERLDRASEEMGTAFRTGFEDLNGTTLLEYLEAEKGLDRFVDVLYTYAYAGNSKNVNDPFFQDLLSGVQDLLTEHEKAVAFVEVKLTSLSDGEWDALFAEEPDLEMYRAYLEDNYVRWSDHRPRDEAHAAQIANLGNELMRLKTSAVKEVTNNVTVAGNITLTNGEVYPVNSQSYGTLLSTDWDRENRRICYEKRFYHLINESDKMAALYQEKALVDDRLAKELNFTDSYAAKLFEVYLTEGQVEEMNAVFKERKGDFDQYYEFRRERIGVDRLMPYDVHLQLLKSVEGFDYNDTLQEVLGSYKGMDPAFGELFVGTVTSNYVDVYPDPEGGKSPGGYCKDMCALGLPSMIFMNYKGLIEDKVSLTHEMGHSAHFYLMGDCVDYLYCGGPEYEMEVPSTFNEELFVDYALENYDQETATAVLANHIRGYENYFTLQPMITEFERDAHVLCQNQENVTGEELNALWTSLSKEYRSDKIGYYKENSSKWTYISHIYLTNNYYTFSYALSKAITLSLFKRYKEDPEDFNERYVGYLSAGTTMTPPEKLRRYFGLEIDRALFEDAMDVVEMRVEQLEELGKR